MCKATEGLSFCRFRVMMVLVIMMGEWRSRKNTRLPGYDYNTPGAYFLTLCTENRRCLLARIVETDLLDGPKIELLHYGKIAAQYINQLNNFYDHISVESYVIMPNHVHILLQVKGEGPSRTPVPTDGDRMREGPSRTPVPTDGGATREGPSVTKLQNSVVSRFVSTFKRFCNKEYGQNIWQSRSYDHVIRDQEDFDKHLQYIYENPFGWQKDEFYAEE